MSALQVLYRDEDLLVINKDAGRVCEGDASSLEDEVRTHFDDRARALHRLDRATSGVLAFSLRRVHHAAFVDLWQKRRVTKHYWAWVEGIWPHGVLGLGGEDLEGRSMETRVKILELHAERSLLELSPRTGRRHQLRLQCSREGHPILGDQRYGARVQAQLGESIALHARSLAFVHPLTKQKLFVEAGLPGSWDFLKIRM